MHNFQPTRNHRFRLEFVSFLSISGLSREGGEGEKGGENERFGREREVQERCRARENDGRAGRGG